MNDISVPFFRPSIGDEEVSAVIECLRSGWLTTGPKTLEFESLFEKYIGNGVTALAVNSATAALHLALEALEVSEGDEVIIPTLTFTATAEVVRYLGATPVFIDIDPATLCMDINALKGAITARTKVIMPVHFAGRSCDMTNIRELADRFGIFVVDDAAHALPTEHKGLRIGCNGAHATAFSFYANKTMTTGEGGMLVSSDPRIIARARTMRLHGIDRDVFNRFTDNKSSWIYDIVAPGFKYNLTDLASALGVVQLKRSDEFRNTRTNLVEKYNDAFKDLPVVLPPTAAEGDSHAWHLYILQLSASAKIDRDLLITNLKSLSIGTSVHYRPLHQMTFWKSFCKDQSFPHADRYFKRCITLPLFMSMTMKEQDYVISAIRKSLRS